jgi:phage-related tail fiber protein
MTTYTKAQVKQAVIDALNQSRPVGSYILFAGKTLPTGYLLCNGAAVSRTTYAALFAVIGTTYGAGNGSTTFNLPNLDGRVLQGTNTLSQVGTKLESGLPNITGKTGESFLGQYQTGNTGAIFNVDFYDNPVTENFANTRWSADWKDNSNGTGNFGFVQMNASKSNAIYGSSSSVQMPAIRTLVAIRY